MTRYRQKPNEVDARQVVAGAYKDLAEWCEGGLIRAAGARGKVVGILFPSFSGPQRADIGDWIIRHDNGQFTMCRSARFAKLYEAVE